MDKILIKKVVFVQTHSLFYFLLNNQYIFENEQKVIISFSFFVLTIIFVFQTILKTNFNNNLLYAKWFRPWKELPKA